MDTLDILSAWSKHLEWKTKLMSFVEGGFVTCPIPESHAVSHQECGFGQWLYSSGLKKYAAFSIINEIEKKHQQLHSVVRRMFQLQQQKDEDGVNRGCAEVQLVSGELIASLETLEKQVNDSSTPEAASSGS